MTDYLATLTSFIELYFDWLDDGELFGVPYLKYALSFLAFMLAFWLVRRLFRIVPLYSKALFTGKGRFAYVRSNVDGDTIRVNDRGDNTKKTSIRMIGVDTPESLKSLYMDIAPFGKEAAAYTKKRLKPGMRVILIYDVQPFDKFGRELVYVYLMNGEFYNATLIRKGYAFAAEFKPNLKYAKLFRKLETKAKNRGKRLWAVYENKGELSKNYKKSNAYRRFKYKHNKKTSK